MLNEVITELDQAIEKAQASLKRDLAKLRTGRAHAGMLDGIRVEYYGQVTPLPQMATVAVPEPRLLTVKPWDKEQLKNVERALRESDLGLNPQVDGQLIRVPIPPLTEERRKDLVKIAKKNAEECRVGIRKARHDAIDMIGEFKQDGAMSEDEADRAKKRVEEVVSAAGQAVDAIVHTKEKEILAL
ncbi:MAG: ribosome recycling factor [Deltaproteobacteria bacterium]|jgi:ribosome recycling factor